MANRKWYKRRIIRQKKGQWNEHGKQDFVAKWEYRKFKVNK